MNRILGSLLLGLIASSGPLWAEDSASQPLPAPDDIARRNREVVLYGTDTEILELVAVLKAAGDRSLDGDFAALLKPGAQEKILTSVLEYFVQQLPAGAASSPLAEGQSLLPLEGASPESNAAHALVDAYSLQVLEYWDQYRNTVIERAISWLSARKEARAIAFLKGLLQDGDEQLRPSVIRALGAIAGEGVAGDLIAWLEEKHPAADLEHEVYRALGRTGDRAASPFIARQLEDEYLLPTAKMALLDAAKSIKDPSLLDSMLPLLDDGDANVRAALIAALAGYEGEAVDTAILGGFRDSFYRTRIAAAEAAGERLLVQAVPFLIFRAERDTVPAVQTTAIRSLARFKSAEAIKVLKGILVDERRSDALRSWSARGLLDIDSKAYSALVVETMVKAVQGAKKKPLYHELARLLGSRAFPGAKELAVSLFASKEVTDRHYALDLTKANKLLDLYPQVMELDTGKSDSLSRKARVVRHILKEAGAVD